jgi:hypothetical protein
MQENTDEREYPVGLWKTVRREVAGAWRSARYDVDRHVGHHRAIKLEQAETAEIVVRQIVWQHRPSPHRRDRPVEMPWAGRQPRPVPAITPKAPRRRTVAATGVALLVAGGAAGTYLAVAGSLAGVKADAHDPAGQPLAAPVSSKKSPVSASTPQARPDRHTHRRAAAAPAKPADIPPVAQPVPTPTRSIEATPTPSASPASTPTPSPSVSTTTTDDASPQISDQHRWRHRDQTGDGR